MLNHSISKLCSLFHPFAIIYIQPRKTRTKCNPCIKIITPHHLLSPSFTSHVRTLSPLPYDGFIPVHSFLLSILRVAKTVKQICSNFWTHYMLTPITVKENYAFFSFQPWVAKTVQHNICANVILLQSCKMLYLKINVGNELDIGKDGAFRPEACMPLYSRLMISLHKRSCHSLSTH